MGLRLWPEDRALTLSTDVLRGFLLGLTIYSIVAFHGLDGHAFNTWKMEHRNVPGGVMWLRDLLPKSINARVLIYGYNSSIFWNASISGIREHATLFAESLQAFHMDDTVGFITEILPGNC
jgi:hypothetical protein